VQVLWDVATGEAICGSPTHADFVLCCRFFSNQSDKLVTAGNYNLQASVALWYASMQPARLHSFPWWAHPAASGVHVAGPWHVLTLVAY
jgi:hypothetical protein